jgi:hypothetical protein
MTTQLTLEGVGPTVIDIPLTQPDLHIDVTIQQRVELDAATVADYAELYREGRDLGRITVFADEAAGCYWLSDGFHRCAAARPAGLTTLPAVVYPGGRREALLYATSCNLHGKARSNADKKKSVLTLLQDAAWGRWSDNHIAKHTGVSQPFVSQLWKSLITVRNEQGESESHRSPTRQYRTKHGTAATMQVGAIGRHGVLRHLQAPRCERCNRPLADPESSSRGIGPVCACTTPTASGNASPDPLQQDVTTSEQATLDPAQQLQTDVEQAHHVAEAWAQRQARACAEAVEHLSFLAGEYGVEVVETQILAVFLAAHGRPAPASHVSQAVDPGAMPAVVSQATQNAPGQAPQTGLAARVRTGLQAHGTQGIRSSALAKELGAPNDKVWRNLGRLVKQGRARKKGTTYVLRKDVHGCSQ